MHTSSTSLQSTTMLPKNPHHHNSHFLHPHRCHHTPPPPETTDDYPRLPHVITDYPPSLIAVVSALAVLFILALAAIISSKCRLSRHRLASTSIQNLKPSGLSRKEIKSLPSFQFSALGGSKDGLDCAVCLSKYENSDILRLLPRCSHAFHVDCVDRWLAASSACPLCRRAVTAGNAFLPSCSDTTLTFAGGFNILEESEDRSASLDGNSINLNSDSSTNEGIEVFVEREGDKDRVVSRSSSIFSIRSSFLRIINSGAGFEGGKPLHKHNHKIVVSDVVFKNRWSDVSSSDLMFLNSEAIFSDAADSIGDKSPAADRSLRGSEVFQRSIDFEERDSNASRLSPPRALLNSAADGRRDSLAVEGRRSVSEITVVPRFREMEWRENPVADGGGVEEKKRKIWFSIAKRTVKLFASSGGTEKSGTDFA